MKKATNKNSDAKIKAANKYNKTHTKIIPIRLNLEIDADILEKLDNVSSKMGYIKNLIREDIKKNPD